MEGKNEPTFPIPQQICSQENLTYPEILSVTMHYPSERPTEIGVAPKKKKVAWPESQIFETKGSQWSNLAKLLGRWSAQSGWPLWPFFSSDLQKKGEVIGQKFRHTSLRWASAMGIYFRLEVCNSQHSNWTNIVYSVGYWDSWKRHKMRSENVDCHCLSLKFRNFVWLRSFSFFKWEAAWKKQEWCFWICKGHPSSTNESALGYFPRKAHVATNQQEKFPGKVGGYSSPLKASFFQGGRTQHTTTLFFWRKVQIFRQQGDFKTSIFCLSSVRNSTKKWSYIYIYIYIMSIAFGCPNVIFWTVGQPGKFR